MAFFISFFFKHDNEPISNKSLGCVTEAVVVKTGGGKKCTLMTAVEQHLTFSRCENKHELDLPRGRMSVPNGEAEINEKRNFANQMQNPPFQITFEHWFWCKLFVSCSLNKVSHDSLSQDLIKNVNSKKRNKTGLVLPQYLIFPHSSRSENGGALRRAH